MNFRLLLACMVMLSGAAHGAPSGVLPDIKVNTKQEKKDAVLNVDRAATAGMSSDETLDGLVGVTSDFPGGEMPAYVVFDNSVPEERMFGLANFQGRIKGTVQCKRIRVGNSPLFPNVKMGVLAEQCTIKSLNH